MEILALLISVISLVFSFRTYYVNHRIQQFQKLAELRTKVTQLRWKIYYRLKDLQGCISTLSKLNHPDANKWDEIIASMQSDLRIADEYSLQLTDVYKTLEKIPAFIRSSKLEELHHNIDCIRESVDVSRNEVLQRMKDYIKELESIARESEQLTHESEYGKWI